VTWSIVARDRATGALGIAVSTRFFAVGARVPTIETGVGAIASQALSNPFYGLRGIEMLRAGASAADTVAKLTDADEGRDHRQLHMMDRAGASAAYTGAACVDWCGHLIRDGFSIAGNMLAGPRVIEHTAALLEKNASLPFARRLIAALQAGEAAGGDKRGKQSAALLIHGIEEYSDLDLRVDDHADPLSELERLEKVSRERYVWFRQFMPTRANPAGRTDRENFEAEIARQKHEAGEA
jgi:uncharacterized Ntn-hydrolase superfamily protein